MTTKATQHIAAMNNTARRTVLEDTANGLAWRAAAMRSTKFAINCHSFFRGRAATAGQRGAGAHACVAMRVVCALKVCECAFVYVVRCGCALRGGERHAREPRWQ
jgi:hypothetical protein